MLLVFTSLLAGALLGIIFSLLRLPIPAPPNLAGVMGIVGVYVGFMLIQWLL